MAAWPSELISQSMKVCPYFAFTFECFWRLTRSTPFSWSEYKAAGNKGACGFALRMVEKFFGRAMLDNAPVVQEDDVLREPARLADVVRHNNDLDAVALRFDQ